MSETELSFAPSPIKGYRLFRQIARFPELLPQMRSTFLDVLVERGVIARESLAGIVGRYMAADGVPDTDASRAEYTDAIIDLLFASVLSPEEVENWVNLVRKRDRCQELGRVVSGEHASAEAIWKALHEFCDIPKGELYISREEAEGIRVALLSHYISSQLPFIGIAKNHVTIRDIDTGPGAAFGISCRNSDYLDQFHRNRNHSIHDDRSGVIILVGHGWNLSIIAWYCHIFKKRKIEKNSLRFKDSHPDDWIKWMDGLPQGISSHSEVFFSDHIVRPENFTQVKH